MTITLDKEFTHPKKEVKVGKTTLYVNEVGFLESQKILANIKQDQVQGIAELISACVTDKDGNRFTVEEVLKLRQSAAKPLMDAALEVNGLTEKN